jgi:hypothetical protein
VTEIKEREETPPGLDNGSAFTKAWRWWKVVWAILRNILVITITIRLFDHVTTGFERIVLCLLILTYESVNWAHTTQLRLAIEDSLVAKSFFLNLLKKAGEETETDEEEIAEFAKKYRGQNIHYYINLVGALIIYTFVVWRLFGVVFG